MTKVLLYQVLLYTIPGNTLNYHTIKSKFKISAPTWNDKFELPNGSYSIPDIEDYF